VDTADESARARRGASGARSVALIAAASFVATGLNYVFLLAAGRLLGSDDYGALAALLGLLTVVLLPTGALQLAVSREVSRRRAVGDEEGADAFGRATLRLSLIATVPIVALAFALVLPLRELLNIESTAAVTLAMAGLIASLVLPAGLGVLQGYERFHAIAALYVLPFALRLGLLAVAAWAGFRLAGAVFAAVAGGIATAFVAVALLREPLRRGARAMRPALGPFFRYLWPVVVGLIGIAVLTNVDLLVVKARFAPDEAGEYAVASAFARVAFFLPATILAVLIPRTAARQARGEDTADILGRSLIVTAAFCSLLTLVYAMTGRGFVHASFGAEFAEAGELLVPFTVSMALFALANILVGFQLSRGRTRYAWIVAGMVPVQVALLALVPNDVRGVIWTNVAVGVVLLTAHELFVASSVPALRVGLGHLRQGISVARRTVLEGVLVLAGAAALVCVLFWPVVVHLGSTIVGTPGSDSTGSVWFFWRLEQESGFHLLGTTHHTLTGAPFGWDEGNGLNVQWLLPYYPTYLVAKIVGEVAAYNLALLSGYVLSAGAMYALVRYLGCSWPVSAWAAVVYVVFPWHLARAEHASLVHLEVLALLLLALVAAARAPSWPRYLLVGAATLACWLTSGYFGTMAVIATVAFTVCAALATRRRSGAWLVLGSTAAAVGAVALAGLASILSGVGRGAGLDRMATDVDGLGIRPLELLVPAAGNLLLGGALEGFHVARLHGSNLTETTNYLGLLTIGLALAWLVLVVRAWGTLVPRLRSATAGLVAATAAGLLFAAPSPLSVLGQEVWMPSRLLWELTPAFRVPSRWSVLVMTALVPLAALGLQAGWRALAHRGSGAQAALVGSAVAVSFLELAIWPAETRFRTELLPAEYAAVEQTPPGVLAEYPLGSSDLYLLWQRRHGRPLLNGAPAGTIADDARRVLLDPAVPGTANALALLGVTAIVIHPQGTADVEVVPSVPAQGTGYTAVARLPDGSSVWQVTAVSAPALVTPTGGFARPRRDENGVVGYALISSAGVATIELIAKAPSVARLSFEATPPAGARRVLRISAAEQERSFTLDGRTSLSVLVEIPRGRSYLLVKTDPAATSEQDAVVLSAPRAETAAEEPELRAVPISPDPGF